MNITKSCLLPSFYIKVFMRAKWVRMYSALGLNVKNFTYIFCVTRGYMLTFLRHLNPKSNGIQKTSLLMGADCACIDWTTKNHFEIKQLSSSVSILCVCVSFCLKFKDGLKLTLKSLFTHPHTQPP